MADNSKIEWTDATWNPVTGCSVVSPGCTNCYAMKLAGTRLRNHPSRTGLTKDTKAGPVWTGEVRFNEEWLDQARRWKKPRKIFVCAHGDLFHESIPDEWIDRVFDVMEGCGSDYVDGKWLPRPWHTFQVLTKRAQRMHAYMTARVAAAQEYADKFKECPTPEMRDSPAARYARAAASGCYFKHIWLGVSVERQKEADERIPLLLETPAAIRFISAEPLLGPVDLTWLVTHRDAHGDATSAIVAIPNPKEPTDKRYLDWVIVGGESGKDARPMNPVWAKSLRDQCVAAGVPFFFKQHGEYRECEPGETPIGGFIEISEPYLIGSGIKPAFKGSITLSRPGKKAAGRLLDGRTWDEFPEAA